MLDLVQGDPELEVNRILFRFSCRNARGIQPGSEGSQLFGMAAAAVGKLPDVDGVEEINARVASMSFELRVTFSSYMSLDKAEKRAVEIKAIINQIFEIKLTQ